MSEKLKFQLTAQKSETRLLSGSYFLTFLIIASLALSAHFLIISVLEQNHDYSRIINMAGRQRMLTQRIAFLSYDINSPEKRNAYIEAINLLDVQHKALTLRDGRLGLNAPLSANARAIYFEDPENLDQHTNEYIALARAAIDDNETATKAKENLRKLAFDDIVPRLDRMTMEYQQENETLGGFLRKVQQTIAAILVATLIFEVFFIFIPLIRKIKTYLGKISEVEKVDSLTGISNRHYYIHESQKLLSSAKIKHQDFILIRFDIDHFKKINELKGYTGGDLIIEAVADILQTRFSEGSLVGRLGGEEFAVTCEGISREEALALSESIRSAVERLQLSLFPDLKITVSGGIAWCPGTDNLEVSLDTMLNDADKALANSKFNGRNRVSVF